MRRRKIDENALGTRVGASMGTATLAKTSKRATPQAFLPGLGHALPHLADVELDSLTQAFQAWYDGTTASHTRRARGRYWLVYLVLRFTGCRLGEALLVNDETDIDFRRGEFRLQTLKRVRKKIRPVRVVPVPLNVTSEVATYLAEFPEMKGKVFGIGQGNFRTRYYERIREAGIPRERMKPHCLRHARCFELLRAGVPVTVVQDLAGHASLLTTARYLRLSGQEARSILKDKGLI